jgi:hypothetical protein
VWLGMIAIPDMHEFSQRGKKENNLLKFRQPSVPEVKEKKVKGTLRYSDSCVGKCALRCVVIHVTFRAIL